MTSNTRSADLSPKPRRTYTKWAAFLGLAFAAIMASIYSGSAGAATVPPLGTAQSFAVLAGAGITNTGPTTITGDVGSYPTLTQTGFASVTLNGTNHGGNAVTQGAKDDLVTAYNSAAGQGPVTTVPTELGGTTLIPGVYDSSAGTFGITGTLTLDAQGDPNAVFIFQMASTLTTASSSNVSLIGGAQACNVFWQVGSSATLGTNSTFRGNILALTSITLTTGATVTGRVLARNGAVTLDSNTITAETCEVVPDDTATVPAGTATIPASGSTPSSHFATQVVGPLATSTGTPTTPTASPTAVPAGATATPASGAPSSPATPAEAIRPPQTGDAGLLQSGKGEGRDSEIAVTALSLLGTVLLVLLIQKPARTQGMATLKVKDRK